MTPPEEPKNLPEDFLRKPEDPAQTSPYGIPPASPAGSNPAESQGTQNPYGASQYGQQPDPYGQQSQYGQPYGQQHGQYGQQPGQYGQPYGQAYPQQGYQQYGQPGYGYGGGYAPLPPHPSASTSMVLGIIGLAGILFCGGFTLVLSPFAWAIGSKAVKEIDANPSQYGGRDQASGGKVMGIIGTVLLILGVLLIGGLIVAGVLAANDVANDPYYYEDTY